MAAQYELLKELLNSGTPLSFGQDIFFKFYQAFILKDRWLQYIIVPEGSDIASPDDLAGKKIGTQRGTTGYIYCSDDFGDDAVVAYDDGLTAVQALNNGQVDAVVIDNAPAKEFVAANPGLVILDTSYAEEDYAIGMAKGNTALEDAVNAALEELKADGTLQSIVDKYITAE